MSFSDDHTIKMIPNKITPLSDASMHHLIYTHDHSSFLRLAIFTARGRDKTFRATRTLKHQVTC